MLQESLSEHIDNASKSVHSMQIMLAKLDKAPRFVETFTPFVNEAISHLKKATTAAFKQHIHYALSPDMFSPFTIHEVERTSSRFALNEPGRTLILLKHVVDPDPLVELPPADERMGNTIVVYSIVSGSQSESFALHGQLALTSYQDDEADAKKLHQDPLIANNAVRRRLLSAITPPPGKVDLDAVAELVIEARGKKPVKPEISTRSWFCFPKEYVLDIVCVYALVAARQRNLDVPGVGERIDLEVEDTLSRYLGMDTLDSKY